MPRFIHFPSQTKRPEAGSGLNVAPVSSLCDAVSAVHCLTED